jgi:hypothetical protein
MTRLKATLTHLLISTTLAGIVICLILFGWYPPPYFWALGGPMLLALLVGIDIVLGPLMTMILFNPAKSRRELTLDLTIIGIVQLSALSYGIHSGYVGRMVYGVFADDAFHLVEASEIAPGLLQKAQPEFQRLPFAGHRIIGTVIPDTDKARSDINFFKAIGAGPQLLPEYYVPLDRSREQIKTAALARDDLQKKHPALVVDIQKLLDAHQLAWGDVAVVPFEVDTDTYTAVVILQDMSLLEVLRQSPR